MNKLKSFLKFFDARDIFVFTGFAFLFWGVSEEYGFGYASIVIGSIILVKGLTKWV